MNLYNKNFRMLLVSNLANFDNLTYEPRPFLCLNYNSGITKTMVPDFNFFNFETAAYIPLDKIKIVKNDNSGTIEIKNRKYSFINELGNFDNFDSIIDNVGYNDDIFYYLYIQKIINLETYQTVISKDYINQTSLVLIHKKNAIAHKYLDFGNNSEHPKALDSTFDILPLSLDYTDTIDIAGSSNIYLNYELII